LVDSLAFGRKIAQDSSAIFVLACLSATRPYPGVCFESFTIPRLFVPVPDFGAVLIWRPNMAIGTVKFFDAVKGFGFIQPEDGDKDVFVHVSAVQNAGMDTLSDGQRVSYEVVTERGKLAASNLQAV